VYDPTLRSGLKLKNYGHVSAETSIRIEASLGGNPLQVIGERPDIVLIPAQASKIFAFGSLKPEDAEVVSSGRKAYEVALVADYQASGTGHGYRYRGRYDVDRKQFDTLDEKHW
jgi:hypothetical protein